MKVPLQERTPEEIRLHGYTPMAELAEADPKVVAYFEHLLDEAEIKGDDAHYELQRIKERARVLEGRAEGAFLAVCALAVLVPVPLGLVVAAWQVGGYQGGFVEGAVSGALAVSGLVVLLVMAVRR